ncbi:MFS transporter [Microbulbifer sp. A4B17]|uniref:MFS transporter n=1 Tax=Microbulbifer sp. A4B17 TaxID=359370 RepID=UPI000D52D7E3|nr:MFS transporter [Microbulbifer sp. A4B17]AWF81923.1 MFS transporter [Microbulbifer sp. A4B17]
MDSKEISTERNLYLGLVALSLAIFLVANDFTAFSPALPAMEREFHSDITTTQWVINGYALVFGVLIISGGRLADMYGRRRVFFVGTLLFVLFSLLGGLAVNMEMLLISRALMGVGGAMMWPSILGMTYSLMTEKRAGLAGGLVITVCGIANSVGPLLGGALADYASWRWIFFINLPISAIALYVCWKVIPDDSPEACDERIDYGGIAFLSMALFALLLAFDLVVDIGFKSPLVLGFIASFFVLICFFVAVEKRVGQQALIPPDVAGNKQFVFAGIATLLISALFFAGLFFIPQFLTNMHGASAIKAGMGLIPMMLSFSIFGFLAGKFYDVLGAKKIVSAATLLMTLGMYILSHIHKDTHYITLIPGLVVLGAGIGLFNSTITTVAITVVDASRASLAGAIIFMFQIAGGAVGLGLNTTIVAMATDMPSGIDYAFTVNAYLAMFAFIICVLFIEDKRSLDQF